MFLYHEPTGAIAYQVLGFSLQHSFSFAVLRPDYTLWDEPIFLFCFVFLKKLLNNRYLRGKIYNAACWVAPEQFILLHPVQGAVTGVSSLDEWSPEILWMRLPVLWLLPPAVGGVTDEEPWVRLLVSRIVSRWEWPGVELVGCFLSNVHVIASWYLTFVSVKKGCMRQERIV